MSLDRTRGSLPPTPKPDPHSILQDLVSHFPFSGSPCVGLSSKNAPLLLTQAAPACPLHPVSGASRLNLSCGCQKPCPEVCAETLYPSLLQTLQGMNFSVLATWFPSSFFSAPGVCLSPYCVTSSPPPATPWQALLLHTSAHSPPPFAESSNQIPEFRLCNSWWEHRHPVVAIHLVLT